MNIGGHSDASVDVLICVCCKRDAVTWKVASEHIVRFIKSKQYKVYVPDEEVEFFRSITPFQFEVIGESIYSNQFAAQIKECLPSKVSMQFGWYLQQLIKLCAIKACDESDIVLIWDADTVPIRPMDFIDKQGRLIYYKGDEQHQPYFEMIRRLLGLEKKVNFSFIAQCFVIKAAWFSSFCRLLEQRHQCSWIRAILGSIDFNEGNGFSEYETLGTFISHCYADQISFSDANWLRLGNSLLGHIAFLNDKVINRKLNLYHFVSFEKWDRAKPYYRKVMIPYFFRIYIPTLFRRSVKI